MKDIEIINGYLNSIKEELLMYKDSLSEKTLDYISKLKKEYNCWEKDLMKINEPIKSKSKDKEDNKNTEVDNDLYDMIDEYLGYLKYKEEYFQTNSQEKLEMSHTELSHFLTLLLEMFNEISENSKDDVDERAMIKATIKSIYQMFG